MGGTIFETPHNLKELEILNRVPLKCSVFPFFLDYNAVHQLISGQFQNGSGCHS